MRYGKTKQERFEKWQKQREADEIGYKVFAWWPVWFPDGRIAWLEYVWKKLDDYTWMSPKWVYKPLPESLAELKNDQAR